MRILLSVLDWGLGHATRCMPLIDALLERSHELFLASSGGARSLLQQKYPDLPVLFLPKYDVSYSRRFNQGLAVIWQIPKVRSAILMEHQMVRDYHKKYHFDRIISDHRYGCIIEDLPSVCIAHQLVLQPPSHFAFTKKWIFQRHLSMFERFDELWIPDYEGTQSLAGSLSQGYPIPRKHRFVGPLSRFSKKSSDRDDMESPVFLGIISGPEPQRSLFEEKLREVFGSSGESSWIVRGKPELDEVEEHGKLKIYPHLEDDRLQNAIVRARCVVSRSGYSSIMDYAVLGVKNAILVPTPGQSEQEYLAEELESKGWAGRVRQNDLSLARLKALMDQDLAFPMHDSGNALQQALDSWL